MTVEDYYRLPHEQREQVDAWLESVFCKPITRLLLHRYELLDEGVVRFTRWLIVNKHVLREMEFDAFVSTPPPVF